VRIEILPCLSDNYAYLLVDDASRSAIVVDPSEAEPVSAALAAHGLSLAAIWCTHHHPDHVGGVPALAMEWPGVPVIGGVHDMENRRIDGQTIVADDSMSAFGLPVRVLSVPGHTLGATAFLVDGALFTGDTLFLGGCGRVFEGTMPQMRASLEALGALAPETRVYCGHEYTVKNLEFAAHVEPGSKVVESALAAARAKRERGEPTVPGTLAQERATNPFLRASEPSVAARAKELGAASGSPDDVFTTIREAKNKF